MRVHTLPCGKETYKKDRKRHRWFVDHRLSLDKSLCTIDFGEGYELATRTCIALGSDCVALRLVLR